MTDFFRSAGMTASMLALIACVVPARTLGAAAGQAQAAAARGVLPADAGAPATV